MLPLLSPITSNNYRLCRRSGCQLGKNNGVSSVETLCIWVGGNALVLICGAMWSIHVNPPFWPGRSSILWELGTWHVRCFRLNIFFSVMKRLVCLEHMETSCDFGHVPLWSRQGRDTTGRAAEKSLGHRLRVERSKPTAWCFVGGRRCPSQNDYLY